MLELLGSVVDLKNLLANIVTGNAGFTTYLILFLVPFCILITIREFFSWFNKRNNLIKRVAKVEKILIQISSQLESLPLEIEKALNQTSKKNNNVVTPVKENTVETRRNYDNFVINEEKFKL